MNELLNHPAVQAGVAPFLAALVWAGLLCRTRLLALAIGAAFVTAVALVLGWSFESLTASRKMVLVGLAATLLVLPLELIPAQPTLRLRALLAGAAGLAGVWMVLRVLQQQPAAAAIGAGVAVAVFMVALVESTRAVHDDAVRAASSALARGLGAGALALLGASASLGQLGIAIGAGAGATLLVQMLTGRAAPLGWTLALPASMVAGLLTLLSVFTGELRWYCMLPLLAVPWATRLVPTGLRPLWVRAILTGLAALVPVALAVALAWVGAAAPVA